MPYEGQFGLIYESKEEERLFLQTRRLNGFHVLVTKFHYDKEAYVNYSGKNWSTPEPKGRGQLGNWGFDALYGTLDHWYRDEAIERGRFTRDESDNIWATWKSLCKVKRSLSHEELLEFWRSNRKDKEKAKSTNRRKRERRRTKTWEAKFNAERDPSPIYRRLKATLPSSSVMDDQLLRSFSTMLAEANDILFQSESMKRDNDGRVPEEIINDYTKLVKLYNDIQKQIADLLKAHGYDYKARRSRSESLTASEVFNDVVDEAAALFDSRAVEIICGKCEMSLGYFIRNFPTVEFTLSTRECPRCHNPVVVVMDAMPDEVMDV